MTSHPLDALTTDEVSLAVTAAKATGKLTEAARFVTVSLHEPTRSEVDSHESGRAVVRRVHLTVVPGPQAEVIEIVVAVPDGRIVEWVEQDGVRPALLFEESFNAIIALYEHPEWKAALATRGITDLDQVQVDPWPTGNFGVAAEEDRRVVRCIPYLRESPGANGYARPIEGLLARVDAARGEVIDIVDFGVVPMPPDTGSYYPEDNGPIRSDLRPLEITQPDGPSFRVEGNRIEWQGWSVRVTLDPTEGLVLHDLAIADGGRRRQVLRRAAIAEMVVPYGDPGPIHGWKNAFDAGEWGLGRMANSLTLGCDCLGEIHYFDSVTADEHGRPTVMPDVICMHEEDYGILWKHHDMHSGRTEVRRSRRLVISSIATVGNYEYGFYWYLYLDGTVQLEVKLTGIMSTAALSDDEPVPPHARRIAPGLTAPVHQHLFCARLDMAVDGGPNEVWETEVISMPRGDDNPWGNGMAVESTRLKTELAARRRTDPARNRTWRIVNPGSRNRLGDPVGYKLLAGATPTLLAHPDSSIGRRAGFATENLWVTPYDPAQRRPAGDYPNQHAEPDGLATWTEADRSIVGTDVVVWHTFGVTHVPRPEDWPVMPVEYAGFHLIPVGFFDGNPSLDVPATTASHCNDD